MCYAYVLLYMHICLFCKYHQTSSESGQDTLAIILKSCAIGAIKISRARYGLHKTKVYPTDHIPDSGVMTDTTLLKGLSSPSVEA